MVSPAGLKCGPTQPVSWLAFGETGGILIASILHVMNHRLLSSFVFIVSLGFLAGCQTVDARIRKNPEAFASVDQATQDKVKQGIIDLGFSENLVYLAIGAPDLKRKSVSATGQTETWIYYASSVLKADFPQNGYYRHDYNPPVDELPYSGTERGSYRDVYVSATHDFPANFPGKKGRTSVVFSDGKVIVIEQTKS